MKYYKYYVIAMLAIFGAGMAAAHTADVYAQASDNTAEKSLVREELRKEAADDKAIVLINEKKKIADNEARISKMFENYEKTEADNSREEGDVSASEQLVGITETERFEEAARESCIKKLNEVGHVHQALVQLVGIIESDKFSEKIEDWYEDNNLENLALFSLNTSKSDVPKELAGVFNPKMIIDLTQSEKYLLQKLVEAEVGTEDLYSKILVANVVLNRLIAGNMGGDTITEVIYAKIGGSVQFSPTAMPEYWNSIEVSQETIEAVDRALSGEDYSQGALYFYAWKTASYKTEKWFANNTQKLFTYEKACFCGAKQ